MPDEPLDDDEDELRLCTRCVGDVHLKNLLRSAGRRGVCSFCKKSGTTLSMGAVGDRVHEMLEAHFDPMIGEPTDGPEYALLKQGLWERPGDPVTEVIAEYAGLDYDVAEDVRKYLSGIHDPYDDIEEGAYGEDALYQERTPDDLHFRETWDALCEDLRVRSRFFAKIGDLDKIFGDLSGLKTRRGRLAVREISPRGKNRFVFRARLALSWKRLEEILKRPCAELAAAPASNAGRMNAEGISVFYGAKDVDTCVSELRPPVGSWVVVGRFEIIRPVRILYLDDLKAVDAKGSRFDPDWATRRDRAAFFEYLVRAISKPVMPDHKAGYMITQLISEYLANEANVDGMVFPSSQREGNNFVLFTHACVAEPDDIPPGTKTEVGHQFLGPDDGYDPDFYVVETVPQNSSSGVGGRRMGNPTKPTLRLDTNSVQVLDIEAVAVKCTPRAVNRVRETKS